MDYKQAIEYIHGTPKFARILGNDLLRRLLEKLGNPQNQLRFVHIAGTNGKGSAAVTLAEIMKRAGYRTGLFTSPYITRFNERIRIDGEEISDEDLAKICTFVRKTIEEYNVPVSEFALDTAIALEYFRDNSCDIVILETGLGGRLDATNVIESPEVSLIMSIGFDHMQYLGDTIEKITAEKCGIIKPGCPVVVYPNLPIEAEQVIESVCGDQGSELRRAEPPEILENGDFMWHGVRYTLSLEGEFQRYNAAAVLETVNVLRGRGFEISKNAVSDGLKSAANPARYERLDCGLIIDGAHNPPAAAALCRTLRREGRKVKLCIGMMSDKDISSYIRELAVLDPRVFVTQIDMPRCASAEELAAEFKNFGIEATVIENPIDAASAALSEAKSTGGIAVVCGSLFLAAEVRRHFLNNSEE